MHVYFNDFDNAAQSYQCAASIVHCMLYRRCERESNAPKHIRCDGQFLNSIHIYSCFVDGNFTHENEIHFKWNLRVSLIAMRKIN